MKNKHHYIHAGYTHYVAWQEKHHLFGTFVDKGFPTTKDAVKIHVSNISKKDDVKDIRIIHLTEETTS